MNDCVVCDGTGWVLAAPISHPNTAAPKFYRKPLWGSAITVPCFVCGFALVGVAR